MPKSRSSRPITASPLIKRKAQQKTRYARPKIKIENYDLEKPGERARFMVDLSNSGFQSDKRPTMEEIRKMYPLAPTPRPPTEKELAALAASRAGTYWTGPNARRCEATAKSTGKPCTQVAVRKSRFCRHHGGKSAMFTEMAKRGAPKHTARTIMHKSLRRALKAGEVPEELLGHPVFQKMLSLSYPRYGDNTDWPERHAMFQRAKMGKELAFKMLVTFLLMQEDPANGTQFYDAVAQAAALGG